MSARVRRALAIALVASLSAGVAGFLRNVSSVAVLQPDGVELTGPGDPYYHLRRVVYTAANFPDVLSVDPYLNYPESGRVVWPATFDLAVSAAAVALADGSDTRAVERIAVRAPPLLGALAAAITAAVAGVAFGAGAGLGAGLLVALLPEHLLGSQIGQLDHHVAVNATTALLAGLAMAAVSPASVAGAALRLGVLGLAWGIALLLWPGALLHVGVLQGLLVVWMLAAEARRAAVLRAWLLALAHAVAGLLVLPFAAGQTWREFGAWSPFVLSNLQPLWFGSGALALAVVALLWARGRRAGPGRPKGVGATRRGRIGSAAAVAAIGIVAALVSLPALREALAVGSGWFTKAEAFQAGVAELAPLTARYALERYTPLFLAFPLAWAWLARRSGERHDTASLRVLLGFAAAFCVMAVAQRRFGNSFSVLLALVWAAAAAEGLRAFRGGEGSRLVRIGAAVGIALLLAGTGVTLARFHATRFLEIRAAERDPRLARRGPLPGRFLAYSRAARWLGQNSPETRGWLDASLQPEYGVLTDWDVGHLVRYRARRPLMQDNFGVYGGRANYEAAFAYFASSDEDAAVATLRQRGIRYVLADEQLAGGAGRHARDSMAARLALTPGRAGAAPAALQRHRLVHYARSGTGSQLPAVSPEAGVAVWELVPGASVVGRAAPGAAVEVSLGLQMGRARWQHRKTVTADAAGRYVLVLPYATDARSDGGVRTGPRYQLRAGDRRSALLVPEAAVQTGAPLRGPDLTPRPPRPARVPGAQSE